VEPGLRRRLRDLLLVGLAVAAILVFAPRACRSPLLADGTAAPAFSLPYVARAGRLTLGELRGARAVLFFWAVWCPACKQMLPGLAAMARERTDVRFVAIHADGGVDPAAVEQRARPFAALTHVLEGERILGAYRATTFPTTYVLGADGRICWGHAGRISSDAVAAALDGCRR
jgi:thiol-disulfide isomerase/thioredoxin